MIIKDIFFYLIATTFRWLRWSCFLGFLGFLILILVLLIGSQFSTPEGNAFILKTLVKLLVPSKLILNFQIKSLSLFPLIIEDFHISIAKMKSSPDAVMSFGSLIIRIEWNRILKFLKFWIKENEEKEEPNSSPCHHHAPSSSTSTDNGGISPASPSVPLSPTPSISCSTVVGIVFTSFQMSSSSVSFKDFLGANPKPNEMLYQSRAKSGSSTSSSSTSTPAVSSPLPGAVPVSTTATSATGTVPPAGKSPSPAGPATAPTSSFGLLIKQFGCKIMKLIEIQFLENFKFDFLLPSNSCEMHGNASSMKIQFKDSKALKSLGLKIFVTILQGKMTILDGEIPEKRIKAVDYRGNHAKICVDYYLPNDFMDVMMIMSGKGDKVAIQLYSFIAFYIKYQQAEDEAIQLKLARGRVIVSKMNMAASVEFIEVELFDHRMVLPSSPVGEEEEEDDEGEESSSELSLSPPSDQPHLHQQQKQKHQPLLIMLTNGLFEMLTFPLTMENKRTLKGKLVVEPYSVEYDLHHGHFLPKTKSPSLLTDIMESIKKSKVTDMKSTLQHVIDEDYSSRNVILSPNVEKVMSGKIEKISFRLGAPVITATPGTPATGEGWREMTVNDEATNNIVEGVVGLKTLRVNNEKTFIDDDCIDAKVTTVRFNNMTSLLIDWMIILQDASNRLPSSRFSHSKNNKMLATIDTIEFSTKPVHFHYDTLQWRQWMASSFLIPSLTEIPLNENRLVSFFFRNLSVDMSRPVGRLDSEWIMKSKVLEMKTRLLTSDLEEQFSISLLSSGKEEDEEVGDEDATDEELEEEEIEGDAEEYDYDEEEGGRISRKNKGNRRQSGEFPTISLDDIDLQSSSLDLTSSTIAAPPAATPTRRPSFMLSRQKGISAASQDVSNSDGGGNDRRSVSFSSFKEGDASAKQARLSDAPDTSTLPVVAFSSGISIDASLPFSSSPSTSAPPSGSKPPQRGSSVSLLQRQKALHSPYYSKSFYESKDNEAAMNLTLLSPSIDQTMSDRRNIFQSRMNSIESRTNDPLPSSPYLLVPEGGSEDVRTAMLSSSRKSKKITTFSISSDKEAEGKKEPISDGGNDDSDEKNSKETEVFSQRDRRQQKQSKPITGAVWRFESFEVAFLLGLSTMNMHYVKSKVFLIDFINGFPFPVGGVAPQENKQLLRRLSSGIRSFSFYSDLSSRVNNSNKTSPLGEQPVMTNSGKKEKEKGKFPFLSSSGGGGGGGSNNSSRNNSRKFSRQSSSTSGSAAASNAPSPSKSVVFHNDDLDENMKNLAIYRDNFLSLTDMSVTWSNIIDMMVNLGPIHCNASTAAALKFLCSFNMIRKLSDRMIARMEIIKHRFIPSSVLIEKNLPSSAIVPIPPAAPTNAKTILKISHFTMVIAVQNAANKLSREAAAAATTGEEEEEEVTEEGMFYTLNEGEEGEESEKKEGKEVEEVQVRTPHPLLRTNASCEQDQSQSLLNLREVVPDETVEEEGKKESEEEEDEEEEQPLNKCLIVKFHNIVSELGPKGKMVGKFQNCEMIVNYFSEKPFMSIEEFNYEKISQTAPVPSGVVVVLPSHSSATTPAAVPVASSTIPSEYVVSSSQKISMAEFTIRFHHLMELGDVIDELTSQEAAYRTASVTPLERISFVDPIPSVNQEGGEEGNEGEEDVDDLDLMQFYDLPSELTTHSKGFFNFSDSEDEEDDEDDRPVFDYSGRRPSSILAGGTSNHKGLRNKGINNHAVSFLSASSSTVTGAGGGTFLSDEDSSTATGSIKPAAVKTKEEEEKDDDSSAIKPFFIPPPLVIMDVFIKRMKMKFDGPFEGHFEEDLLLLSLEKMNISIKQDKSEDEIQDEIAMLDLNPFSASSSATASASSSTSQAQQHSTGHNSSTTPHKPSILHASSPLSPLSPASSTGGMPTKVTSPSSRHHAYLSSSGLDQYISPDSFVVYSGIQGGQVKITIDSMIIRLPAVQQEPFFEAYNMSYNGILYSASVKDDRIPVQYKLVDVIDTMLLHPFHGLKAKKGSHGGEFGDRSPVGVVIPAIVSPCDSMYVVVEKPLTAAKFYTDLTWNGETLDIHLHPHTMACIEVVAKVYEISMPANLDHSPLLAPIDTLRYLTHGAFAFKFQKITVVKHAQDYMHQNVSLKVSLINPEMAFDSKSFEFTSNTIELVAEMTMKILPTRGRSTRKPKILHYVTKIIEIPSFIIAVTHNPRLSLKDNKRSRFYNHHDVYLHPAIIFPNSSSSVSPGGGTGVGATAARRRRTISGGGGTSPVIFEEERNGSNEEKKLDEKKTVSEATPIVIQDELTKYYLPSFGFVDRLEYIENDRFYYFRSTKLSMDFNIEMRFADRKNDPITINLRLDNFIRIYDALAGPPVDGSGSKCCSCLFNLFCYSFFPSLCGFLFSLSLISDL
jgi:hypothetical protein